MEKYLEKFEAIYREELRNSPTARRILSLLRGSEEIQAYQMQANVMAVTRLGYSDHGRTHAEIVTANALKILRILTNKGEVPNMVKDHRWSYEDAQIVIMCATYVHDLGNSVHRTNHETFSVIIGRHILYNLLSKHFEGEKLHVMVAEILHAVYAHDEAVKCLTLEAGVATIADATDSARGRSRITFKLGDRDMHTLSSQSVDEVNILEGEKKPLKLELLLNNAAGVFQIERVLMPKVDNSGLRDKVEIVAKVGRGKDIIKELRI